MSATPNPSEIAAGTAAADAAVPARKPRDPWFDNAKMLLVTLVVVGHTWQLLRSNAVNTWLYDFLYLWHVPAFVMVTGYMSRSFTWSRKNMSRLITTVAVPYVIFEAALAAFRVFIGGEALDGLFADPHWPMWYLSALFLWRLVTPVFTVFIWIPAALPVAVLVSVLGGLTSGDLLDAARVMGLLPFFVVGLVTRPEHLELLSGRTARIAAAATMTLGLGLAGFVNGHLATEWLYWRSSYSQLDASLLEGMALRLGLLVVGAVLSVCFFTLVPRRGGWFSTLGAATLVVYLFHGFAVKSLEYSGFPGWASAHPVLSLLLATPAAVALALLLAWPPVAARLNIMVDPVGSWRRR